LVAGQRIGGAVLAVGDAAIQTGFAGSVEVGAVGAEIACGVGEAVPKEAAVASESVDAGWIELCPAGEAAIDGARQAGGGAACGETVEEGCD
jgi:hypothetical protein